MEKINDREFWCEFLDIYKAEPSLWKIKSAEYSNRICKANAYAKLIEKLKEINPEANRELVVKKINTFRTNFRKELKKVRDSEKSGAGQDDVYVPSLWYFSQLFFLEDQEGNIPGRSTIDIEISPPPKKKKITAEDNLIKLACDQLQAIRHSKKDESSIAKSWAEQYDEMRSDQKILSRKIVYDVLFQGCIGNLSLPMAEQIYNVLHDRSSSSSNILSLVQCEVTNGSSENSQNVTVIPPQYAYPFSPNETSASSFFETVECSGAFSNAIQTQQQQPMQREENISTFYNNFDPE